MMMMMMIIIIIIIIIAININTTVLYCIVVRQAHCPHHQVCLLHQGDWLDFYHSGFYYCKFYFL